MVVLLSQTEKGKQLYSELVNTLSSLLKDVIFSGFISGIGYVKAKISALPRETQNKKNQFENRVNCAAYTNQV